MRKLGIALFAALAFAYAGAAAAQTYHQPWRPLTFRPGFQVMGVAGGGYTGPGDVVSGAKVWLGLRAYNAAQAAATTKAIKLVRTDTHSCDVLVATSGALGVTANCSAGAPDNGQPVATWCNATTCSIDIFYDQSGNSNDFSASTSGTRATLAFSCLGSLPCANFGAGTAYYQSSISDTAQPFTTSAVAIRTGATGAQNDLFVLGNGTFYDGSANSFGAYFGTGQTVTASDNAWHALQVVTNSASSTSTIVVDATQTGGLNLGAGNTGASFWLGAQNSSGLNPLNGKLTEIGLWGGVAFNGTQQTNVCHNQFTYWGTPTSC